MVWLQPSLAASRRSTPSSTAWWTTGSRLPQRNPRRLINCYIYFWSSFGTSLPRKTVSWRPIHHQRLLCRDRTILDSRATGQVTTRTFWSIFRDSICNGRAGVKATFDAPAVAAMRRAGAIPLGVTNVSELCMWMESGNTVAVPITPIIQVYQAQL